MPHDTQIEDLDEPMDNQLNRVGDDHHSLQADNAPLQHTSDISTHTDLLGVMLTRKWDAWSYARFEQEGQWLKNIRQVKSIYEAAIIANIKAKKSKLYLKITQKKSLESHAHQIHTFFPGSGIKHWAISSTPIPEIEGQMTSPESQAKLIEIVKQNTKKMSKLIEDQLVEANYPNSFRCGTWDSTVMGTGIIVSGEVGGVKNNMVFPKIRYMNPFDGYPDPDATTVESMSGFFERMVISRKEFGDLRFMDGFDKAKIDNIIILNSKGNHVKLPWEHDYNTIYNKGNEVNIESVRFEVLKFDGYLNGVELSDVGFDIPDEDLTTEYRVEIWISNNIVIKSEISLPVEGDRLPYNIFPHFKNSNQLYGAGVPEVMDDSQDMVNAGARRLIDDLATAGTVLEIATDQLTPASQKTVDEIYHGRIFETMNSDLQSNIVKPIKIPTMSTELMAIIAMFRRFIDDESNAPSQGSGFAPTGAASAARTASGLSILKGEADIVKNTPVKNIDDYLVVPLIRSLYNFNMKWNGHLFAGGLDAKVKALGSKSLLTKEIQNAQMINLLNVSNNDRDAMIVKRPETYGDIVEAMGMNPEERINTPEEIAQLTNNPQREKLKVLETEKLVLENEKLSKEINEIDARTAKELSAVDHDSEILRQSGVKLEADIINNIMTKRDSKKGDGKALTTTTKNEIRRDGLKTTDRENR